MISPKHSVKTKEIYKYDRNVVYIEAKIKKNVLPIFIQPQDSDKVNFIKYHNRTEFFALIDRYYYVPVQEEGLLYALLASNCFKLKESEYFIYYYLSKDYFSDFFRNIGEAHLMRGVRQNESNSLFELERRKKNEKK